MSNNKELAARLMAVQACYQISHNAKSVRSAVQEALENDSFIDIDGEPLPKPHSALFKKILFSLDKRLFDINQIVEANINRKPLSETIVETGAEGSAEDNEGNSEETTEVELKLSPEKEIEPLLKSILLCGVTELLSHQDINTPIIIDDYLNVTHAFYEKQQVSFVNGILDKVASNLRG